MKVLLSREAVHTGNLILVNREYGYREHGCRQHECWQQASKMPAPGEGAAGFCRNFSLKEPAAGALKRLMSEIHGWDRIVPVSAWRSQEEQQKIWDQSMEENGREFTEKYVAVPGHSEHQTGLAIDLGRRQEQIDFIRPDFPYEGICQRFRELSGSWGFVERYPADKEHITGIGHEPWHFRYVGLPHAAVMAREGLVLEEYIAFLKDYEYGSSFYGVKLGRGEARISYIRAKGDVTELELPAAYPCELSGDNVEGFILTEWRHFNGE